MPRWCSRPCDFAGVSGAGGSHGFNTSTAGFYARITQNWAAGLAFGYSHIWLSANGLQSDGTMDNYDFAFYSGLTLNRAYARGALSYIGSNGRLSRALDLAGAGRAATGRPDADEVLGMVETGYDAPLMAMLTVKPFAQLDAAQCWQGGFTETGAGDFDLMVAGQGNNSAQTTPGAALAEEFDLLQLGAPLSATVTAGWGHEFAETARPVTAAFAGAPGLPFSVDAAEVDRNTAVVSTSLAMTAGRAKILARYDGQYGARTHASAVTGGVSVSW